MPRNGNSALHGLNPIFLKNPEIRSRVFHYLYYFRSDATKMTTSDTENF